MKRFILFVVGLLMILGLTGLACWQSYRSFLDTPLNVEAGGFRLQVARGETVRSVISDLEQSGITSAGWQWRLLTRMRPVTIKAGEYKLKPGLSPPGLLELLSEGNVVHYRFTIIEGWTFKQLKQGLAQDPVLQQSIPDLQDDLQILQAIDSDANHPEGWFLPETYQFVRGDSDIDILSRSHAAMKTALEEAWASRQDDLPIKSPYEFLTLASIIERESGVDAERPEIAGVFTRRLEQHWRLETDPTVIYGLGDAYDGDIRRRDLQTDTPYNTYTRYGLPPTPISMPGKAALEAVASPADGTAMFFVASGTGGHVFSDTLEQHNAAVRKMLRKRP